MVALLTPATASASSSGKIASLVNTIDTSLWSPPSPDPGGIDWWAAKNELLVVDSEVEELVCPNPPYPTYNPGPPENCPIATTITHYQGVNAWETTTAGTVQRTSDTTSYTVGPTDVRTDGSTVYMTDDNLDRVFVIDVGPDGQLNTTDDVRTSFSTRAFNDYDPEGIDYANGTLYVTGGVSNEVYHIDPGQNGVFDGTDDQVSCFDTASLGTRDPEDVAVDPVTGNLYLASHNQGDREVAVASPAGSLVDLVNMRNVLPYGTQTVQLV